jgi:hypothetical protein
MELRIFLLHIGYLLLTFAREREPVETVSGLRCCPYAWLKPGVNGIPPRLALRS